MSGELHITGLDAGRDGVTAVRDLELSVHAGEIVALLGPNGAGKTTTLDTAVGILPALAGTITVDGHPIRGVRDAVNHGVSYLPEHRGLFRQLTVRENLRLRTRSGKAATRLLAEHPTLAPLADRRSGLLSGGEQQLLALACALATRPRLLLIDELTMGLAPVIIKDLVAVIERAARSGIGILLVEQHIHLALDLADRAFVLRQGRIALSGTAARLRVELGEVENSYFDSSKGDSR